jgi:hypothetical protein
MNMPEFYALRANDPNADEGPRNASVLTFSGDTNDSMVKELTQNSLDARAERNGNLEIKINVLDIAKSDIPDFETFISKLCEMRDYYASMSTQYTQFFETAFKSLEEDTIKVLVFEDFLTKGLTGDDKDKQGTFKKCVNDENISGGKETDSLGNHGIGKNSVFGYSSIQTVFYCSFNLAGEYKFKGVSKLGTYEDSNGIHRSNRMFYGNVIRGGEHEEIQLVSELNEIPEKFRRTEPGLSQFVLGAEVGDDWEDNIKKAFLTNYWFLFENDKLKVTVGDVVLSKDNYEECAMELFEGVTSDLNPLPYIKAFRNSEVLESEIYKIGNVKLFLLEEEEGDFFPNRVLYLRDGMKIKTGPLGVRGLPTPIAGVIYCTDSDGNSILGAMEPHAHDDFLPALVEKKGAPNGVGHEEAKRIIYELDRFKAESVREIKNKYAEAVSNVEIVDKLFEGIMPGSKGKGGAGKDSETENESFEIRNKELETTVTFSSGGSNSIATGEDEVTDGVGPESGLGEGGKGQRSGKGKKKGTDGGGVVGLGPRKKKNKRNVESRFFLTERTSEQSEYKIVLKSDSNYGACNITIGQVGDNRSGSGGMGAELIEVKDASGNVIPFQPVLSSEGVVSGYELVGVMVTGKDVLDIKVSEKTLSAFTIIETK